ncbi:MucR family transcriptional regulator [Nguyenibacter vanlangensis]|uniref:MucR family transcriptional regulator n=1 Tax=Nguyenibacter vanlangensis TaxID=1216886 RepID=A0A7Y7M668_9PROT|nr:MucR family transcriptional regulator [Nguyenibacter vanlangensis]
MNSDKDIILGRLNATAQIVTAHLATAKVETDQLPNLVQRIYASTAIEEPDAKPHALTPRETSPAVAQGSAETERPFVRHDEAQTLDIKPSSSVQTEAQTPKPAVPIRESVFPDYVICLEDGKKLKSLKRHLMSAFGMTVEDYKEKWSLPDTYPTVAPNYAEMRRRVAQSIGLGRKSSVNGDAKETAAKSQPSAATSQTPASQDKGRRPIRKTDELRLANAFSR